MGLIDGKGICIIAILQLATCALTFKVASLSARPEWCLVQCVPGCVLAWLSSQMAPPGVQLWWQ